MNIHAPIATHVAIFQRARQELVSVHGFSEDDPDFLALLDGMSDLGDQLAQMLRRAREKEAQAKALGDIISEMKDRKSRLESSAEGLRRAAAWAAADAGIPKLERPDFTATFGITKPSLKGPDDPTGLPDEFLRIKREVDKVAIRQALESGRAVPGWQFSNGRPSVTVRTR